MFFDRFRKVYDPELEEEIRKVSYSSTYDNPIQNHFIRTAEYLLCGKKIIDRYVEFRKLLELGASPAEAINKALNVKTTITEGSIRNIPKTGSTLIVCNHPFGIMDGLSVATLVREYRSDLKVLAHKGVSNLPQFSEFFLPVVFDTSDASKEFNKQRIDEFKSHITNGGIGILFPAGAVSTRLPLWKENQDPPWFHAAAKWSKNFKWTVVPVFIEGECSYLFHGASHLGMTLRLSTLLYENARLIDSTIQLRIRSPLHPYTYPDEIAIPEITKIFRDHCYGDYKKDKRKLKDMFPVPKEKLIFKRKNKKPTD